MNEQVEALYKKEEHFDTGFIEVIKIWAALLLASIPTIVAGLLFPWGASGAWIVAGAPLVIWYVFMSGYTFILAVFAPQEINDRRRARRSAAKKLAVWYEMVEANETGPELPENGWEVWWPSRSVIDNEVHFALKQHRWASDRWTPLLHNSAHRERHCVSSGNTSALASAWADACLEAKKCNKANWLGESERRRTQAAVAYHQGVEEIQRESIFQDAREIMRGA